MRFVIVSWIAKFSLTPMGCFYPSCGSENDLLVKGKTCAQLKQWVLYKPWPNSAAGFRWARAESPWHGPSWAWQGAELFQGTGHQVPPPGCSAPALEKHLSGKGRRPPLANWRKGWRKKERAWTLLLTRSITCLWWSMKAIANILLTSAALKLKP